MNGFLGVEGGDGDSKVRDKTAQANKPAGELRTGPGLSHHVTLSVKHRIQEPFLQSALLVGWLNQCHWNSIDHKDDFIPFDSYDHSGNKVKICDASV